MNLIPQCKSSDGKESTCNEGDLGSVPGLGRCPGEGKGYPLQYSDLENSIQSMGSQRIGHHRVTFTFTFSFVCLLPWITVVQWPVIQCQKTTVSYMFPSFPVTYSRATVIKNCKCLGSILGSSDSRWDPDTCILKKIHKNDSAMQFPSCLWQ